MKILRVGGVPEHFNTPWKYAIENQLFKQVNIEIDFIEYGDGTGALCRDLSSGTLDMAIVLTEGIVKYQKQDPSLKIISTYIESPLNWGIHVSLESNISSVKDLKEKTFAISRFGSGSHLMVKLLAEQYGWNFSELRFLDVGGIDNLGKALLDRKADAFLWEIFTTKPYLEKYHLRLLDNLLTPWPCFQLAARNEIYNDKDLIKKIFDVIFPVCHKFNSDHSFALENIQQHYPLNEKDLKKWIQTVHWSDTIGITNLKPIFEFLK